MVQKPELQKLNSTFPNYCTSDLSVSMVIGGHVTMCHSVPKTSTSCLSGPKRTLFLGFVIFLLTVKHFFNGSFQIEGLRTEGFVCCTDSEAP